MEICRYKECIREYPGNRASEAYSGKAYHRNKNEARKRPCNHLKHPRQYRKRGEAHSLNKEPHNVYKRKRKIECRIPYKELSYLMYYLLFAAIDKELCQKAASEYRCQYRYNSIYRT